MLCISKVIISIYFLSTSNGMPTRGSSKEGSHVYFLLIVAIVLILWRQIVLLWHQVTMVASEQHLYQTIVHFDKTILLPRKLVIGSIHDYIFCYCLSNGYSIWGTENYNFHVLFTARQSQRLYRTLHMEGQMQWSLQRFHFLCSHPSRCHMESCRPPWTGQLRTLTGDLLKQWSFK